MNALKYYIVYTLLLFCYKAKSQVPVDGFETLHVLKSYTTCTNVVYAPNPKREADSIKFSVNNFTSNQSSISTAKKLNVSTSYNLCVESGRKGDVVIIDILMYINKNGTWDWFKIGEINLIELKR